MYYILPSLLVYACSSVYPRSFIYPQLHCLPPLIYYLSPLILYSPYMLNDFVALTMHNELKFNI